MGKKGRKSCNPGRKSYNLNNISTQVALIRKKDEIEEKEFEIKSLGHIRDLIRESKIWAKVKNGNGDNGNTDNLAEK